MSDDAYVIDSSVYVPNPVPHNSLFDDPGEIARVLAATEASIKNTPALVCRHCGDPLKPVPGGYVGRGGWDHCADADTFHEPDPAGDMRPLVDQVLAVLRRHVRWPDDRVALQLVVSGAVPRGDRALAVQLLVDRHVCRDRAETIVDDILNHTKETRNG